MKSIKAIGLALVAATLMNVSYAQKEKTVEVGGATMYPAKNIIENAMNSKDHTTLVAAVKAAGLVETLQGVGPFTVFAPTNAAFDMLPAGTVESLVKPENKEKLASILTYHVVAGKLDSKELEKEESLLQRKEKEREIIREDLKRENEKKERKVNEEKN